jgi:hypothetical protein
MEFSSRIAIKSGTLLGFNRMLPRPGLQEEISSIFSITWLEVILYIAVATRVEVTLSRFKIHKVWLARQNVRNYKLGFTFWKKMDS